MSRYVRDVMTNVSNVIVLEPDESIVKAQKLMREKNVHSVLIRPPQGGTLWRIFTSSDLLIALNTGMDPKKISVAEFASIARYSARPDWTLEKSLNEMVNNGIKHLVVLDGDNLIGVLSSQDLLANY